MNRVIEMHSTLLDELLGRSQANLYRILHLQDEEIRPLLVADHNDFLEIGQKLLALGVVGSGQV